MQGRHIGHIGPKYVTLAILGWMITLAITFPLNGQEIIVSQDITVSDRDGYQLLGKYDERILLYVLDGTQSEVHGYSKGMQSHWERNLEFEKQSIDIISVVPDDSTFHVIYGYRYKGDYFLKHREYDPALIIVDSVTIDVLSNLYFSPQYQTVRSEDDSKLLFIRTDRESDISVKSYDIGTKSEVWNKQIVFDGISYRRDFRLALISNAGDMYVIMDHEKNSRRFKEFVIINVDTGSRSLRKRSLDLGEYVAQDIFAKYDNVNERLMIAGLYNEKIMSRSVGIYTFTLDGASRESNLSWFTFDTELLEEIHGKSVPDSKGVTDFLVKDIVLREDGGAVVLAEMHKEYGRRPSMPTGRTDYTSTGWVDYYFEDVIALSVHPDGEKHWETVLHKRQYSQDDDGMYSSFFVFKTPEMIRLVYNDEIRNQSTVSEYVIRGNGYHKRRSVFSTDYQRLGLRFRDAVQIDYNEFIVPSERNNKLNLVSIRFDEAG